MNAKPRRVSYENTPVELKGGIVSCVKMDFCDCLLELKAGSTKAKPWAP